MSEANGDNKMMFECPHCKQRFSIKMPVPELPMNGLKASVAVAAHEKPIRCQNMKCAKYFVWVATAIQFAWATVPISDEQAQSLGATSLVVPPLGTFPKLH